MIPIFVRAALFAAFIIGFATYLAMHSQPILAGFLVTIPVTLSTMLFIDEKNVDGFKDYIWAFCLGIISYTIAVITFYHLYTRRNVDKKTAIIYSIGLWFGLVVLAYFILSAK